MEEEKAPVSTNAPPTSTSAIASFLSPQKDRQTDLHAGDTPTDSAAGGEEGVRASEEQKVLTPPSSDDKPKEKSAPVSDEKPSATIVEAAQVQQDATQTNAAVEQYEGGSSDEEWE